MVGWLHLKLFAAHIEHYHMYTMVCIFLHVAGSSASLVFKKIESLSETFTEKQGANFPLFHMEQASF